jgi:CubicO group peptidase (beta-lactamase class C family)
MSTETNRRLPGQIGVYLFSGGGGLVSSTMDYMGFAEAMRNGGELQGARILSSKTVKYMAKNHLPASMASGGSGEQPTLGQPLRGFGFGLGFGQRRVNRVT